MSVGLEGRKVLLASRMPVAVRRSAISAERQRLTLRRTCRAVPSAFSMVERIRSTVQASERRSSCGSPRRMTVRISSRLAQRSYTVYLDIEHRQSYPSAS